MRLRPEIRAFFGFLIPFSLHGGDLAWTGKEHDFGRLDRQQPMAHAFEFRNAGKDTVRILATESPCGCLASQTAGEAVPPGGSGSVLVSFNSGEREGPVDALVKVATNRGSDTLRIRAWVQRKISIEPPALDFRNVFRGDTTYMAAFITWNRPGKPTFPKADWGASIYSARMEPAGERWVLHAWAAPRQERGRFADTIRLATGDPDWPMLAIPVSGEIRGRLLAEPAFMDFGTISAKERNNAMVTLRSLKRRPYEITRLDGEPKFLVAYISRNRDRDWTAHGLLYPGAPVGAFEGRITLYVNHAKTPETVIPVRGTIVP